jgi:signal peptidase I
MLDKIVLWLKKYLGIATAGDYEIPSPAVRIFVEQVETIPAGETVNILLKNFAPGTRIITVADTGSMEPLIDAGNLVILEPVNTLAVGDMATYVKDETTIVLHRIIEILGDEWYRFQGDNCAIPDAEWIHRRQLREVVRGIIY